MVVPDGRVEEPRQRKARELDVTFRVQEDVLRLCVRIEKEGVI